MESMSQLTSTASPNLLENMEEQPTEKNYSALKEDPEALLLLLNKYVKLKLIKNTSFDGFIHSIDPVTHSVILYVPKEDKYQSILVPGHAVLAISELPTTVNPPARRQQVLENNEEIMSRKQSLISWFKYNLLPVKESEKNIVVGHANVLPPYSVKEIYAENPVIALQIRKIMEQMPQDFKPK